MASGSPTDPAQWPAVTGADPDLTTTPHTIRFSGADRYQTNLALGLALRGKGDFPFDTSDPTSANAAGLARADDWWGAASCPRSIIVVAGDTFADSLAAASLSDPTDRSEQPRLERVAAADPLFDPVGGFDRVDTAYAPIVVTTAARAGATSLASTARLTASDLRNGGCTTARNAIIVGGRSAVAPQVETELVSLGYTEVFRVAGTDRYDTAARVATALGTGTPPPAGTPCVDPVTSDGTAKMGFYGNAVAEFRPDPTSCVLLPHAVVLADGSTGADALASGWWTSYWQVPVLLTAADGSLPPATRTALQTLDVGTIIVLGGQARIPESTVDQAERLAGTTNSGRITGVDRYATSVDMASKFGGWWPTGDASDFDGDEICLASSSGNGVNAAGWADALASGPLCGRIGAAAAGSPLRSLTPVDGGGELVGRSTPSHTAMPVLLTATGDASVSTTVDDFLDRAFATEQAAWCRSGAADTPCARPGFAAVFGGPTAVSPAAVSAVTRTLAGGPNPVVDLTPPLLDEGFATTLDLGPVFRMPATFSRAACYARSAVSDARWLSITKDLARRSFVREVDLVSTSAYADDGSFPVCVDVGIEDRAVTAVGADGATSQSDMFVSDPSRTVSLSGPVMQTARSTTDSDGLSWLISGGVNAGASLVRGGQTAAISTATLDLHLRQSAGRRLATGTAVIETSAGRLEGRVDAEGLVVGGRLELRGGIRFSFPQGDATGGFSASLPDGSSAGGATWRFDAHTAVR